MADGKMSKYFFASLLTASLVFCAHPSRALTKMDDSGIKDALQYGKTHTLKEIANSPEWTIKGSDGTDAYLMTPYSLVALKAAKAKYDGVELSFEEVKNILTTKEKGIGILDLLPLSCSVCGPTIDYLKDFRFELCQNGNIIKPIEAETDKPVLSEKDHIQFYFTNYKLYFTIHDIDAETPLTLVVISPKGEETHYEFDLGNMR